MTDTTGSEQSKQDQVADQVAIRMRPMKFVGSASDTEYQDPMVSLEVPSTTVIIEQFNRLNQLFTNLNGSVSELKEMISDVFPNANIKRNANSVCHNDILSIGDALSSLTSVSEEQFNYHMTSIDYGGSSPISHNCGDWAISESASMLLNEIDPANKRTEDAYLHRERIPTPPTTVHPYASIKTAAHTTSPDPGYSNIMNFVDQYCTPAVSPRDINRPYMQNGKPYLANRSIYVYALYNNAGDRIDKKFFRGELEYAIPRELANALRDRLNELGFRLLISYKNRHMQVRGTDLYKHSARIEKLYSEIVGHSLNILEPYS